MPYQYDMVNECYYNYKCSFLLFIFRLIFILLLLILWKKNAFRYDNDVRRGEGAELIKWKKGMR